MTWKDSETLKQEKKEAEKLAKLPSEVDQMKLQIQSVTDENEFLKACIMEMAGIVYAGD